MKTKTIISIVFIVLFLIFAVWKIISTIYEGEEMYNKLAKEYKELSINDSVNSKVLAKYYPIEWRGAEFAQYITFTDNKKVYFDIKYNIASESFYFGDIVKPGVSLKKRSGSDTLTVILSNEKEYLFILNIKNNQ